MSKRGRATAITAEKRQNCPVAEAGARRARGSACAVLWRAGPRQEPARRRCGGLAAGTEGTGRTGRGTAGGQEGVDRQETSAYTDDVQRRLD
jgi:hypothetical protein